MSRQPPPDVVSAAQASARATGVPASITLAQWALESAWGAKQTGAFNFFGIKGSPPDATLCATHEVVDGVSQSVNQWFANYSDLSDGFRAHADLLAGNERYAPAMAVANDPYAFASQLQACGYATDPNYAASLKSLLAENNLTQYDLTAQNEGVT